MMNFGRGFPISGENDIRKREFLPPVTPEKQIPSRSNMIPLDPQGNQWGRSNWNELLGLYGGLLKETSCNVAVHNFNAGEVMQQLGDFRYQNVVAAGNRNVNSNAVSVHDVANEITHGNGNPLVELFSMRSAVSANKTPSKRIPLTDRFALPNSYSQLGNSWTESYSGHLMLEDQHFTSCPNQRINGGSLLQMPKDGSLFWYGHDLNSPPSSELDAASGVTTTFPFAPVTPEHRKQFRSHHLSEELNFSAKESLRGEKDKQEKLVTSIRKEAFGDHSDELLQNIVESSSAILFTALKEKNDSDNGGDRGIDLNKTPQKKPPKRRKHRPKVVVEGKPKRTQKPKAPKTNNSSENPSGKRKYVRKKGLKASATHQTDVTDEVPPAGSEAKSCRRVLNFDTDNGTRDGNHDSPKTNTSTEKPSGKQKYVRKKSLKASTAQQADLRNEVAAHAAGSEAKSSEGVLNFNSENKMRSKSYEQPTNHLAEMCEGSGTFQLDLDSHDTELYMQINSVPRTKSPEHSVLQNGQIIDKQKAINTFDFTHSVNNTPSKYVQLPEQRTPLEPSAKMKVHTLNIIARTLTMRNANPCQNSGKNNSSQVHCVHRDVIGHTVFQADTAATLEKKSQLMLNGTVQLMENDMANLDRIGSKRDYCQSTKHAQHCSVPSMESPKSWQEMFKASEYKSVGSNFDRSSEYHKKKKTENQFYPTISSALSCIEAIKDSSRQLEARAMSGTQASSYASQMNDTLLDSYFQGATSSKELNSGVNRTCGNCYVQPMTAELNIQKQHTFSVQSNERVAEKISQCSIPVCDLNSLTAITELNQLSQTPPQKGPPSSNVQGIETCHDNIPFKKQMMVLTSSNQVSSKDKVLLQEHEHIHCYDQSSIKSKGSPGKQKHRVCVDEITFQLKGLNINKENNEIVVEDRSALVLYKGDSKIVPYEGFDPIKKRKPRPKVDLDSETNRIWNLLMGKEGSESTKAADKDKEKWWEEERRVFHGRVDSFIARMHLVQGDRRFTQWKGSVVDSVIGVFLTQNVSDHLSSSAFMSLAAKFPLCSTTVSQTCCENGTSVMVERPEVQTQEPRCTIKCHEVIPGHPVYDQGSCESFWHRTDSVKYFDSFTPIVAEEPRSSSGSNSEAFQTTGYKSNMNQNPPPNIRLQTERTAMFKGICGHAAGSSFSDERPIQGHQQPQKPVFNRQNPRSDGDNNLNGSTKFACLINPGILHMQGSNVHPSNTWFNVIPGSGMREEECFRLSGEESMSFLHSTASKNWGEKIVNSMSNMIQQIAEGKSRSAVQQNGMPGIDASNMPTCAFLNKHSMHQGNFKSGFHALNNEHVINNHQGERSENFVTSVTDLIRAYEAWVNRQTAARQLPSDDPKFTGQTSVVEEVTVVGDKQKLLKNKTTDIKGQFHSSSKPIGEEGTNNSNTRKRKAEHEKQKAFEWDGLRRQVLFSGKRRERNKDTMDSLNYEALRNADVNEISNAIKERGMNNMLAERIKDFLNRLVREHGSIDLEWLRDVPPDSAKNYLLSIRGLGLKSVECVRLLTLHHLAFPVDTNVGRIAVRLGWVPLQPLPESLQLHLLELYPVLESIQKYLWPRLCKLDQRTLYELHYQMITFGKVFCTKSKPNCNACPMRGECRHFASAFASARFALPGPEEQSIVGSTAPVVNDKIPAAAIKTMALPDAADQNPAMLIKPISLPLSGNSTHKEGYINGKCEPIIEEPKTPEPSTEVSESDIEDAFYEDPDEIPMIELNIEEFTLNLQNYVQKNNMELQESDMSKALVVLDTQVVSIPAPKLKNVSRLRTEHQVYELPDSHPLLKVLHRREPDDPSPYLLAIWTPGETANSIQPPESRCESQASGKMCNGQTCFSCNSVREENSHTVRGTLLIPCRTAMRGSFPLNGTYFQVNEVFADHESSLNPIDVPRAWIWNLPRRTVYFGTSVSTIFKGLSTEGIQYCFWRGFVCVRGFDQKTRAPRPLMARLHFPASRLAKMKNEDKKEGATMQR